MNKYIKYSILMFTAVFISCSDDDGQEQGGETPPVITETAYDILVDVNETQGEVSKLLMGFNTIYCFEKDNFWQQGTGQMPNMFKRFNTGILRYPGGAVVNRNIMKILNVKYLISQQHLNDPDLKLILRDDKLQVNTYLYSNFLKRGFFVGEYKIINDGGRLYQLAGKLLVCMNISRFCRKMQLSKFKRLKYLNRLMF